jgi:hypothetical protein
MPHMHWLSAGAAGGGVRCPFSRLSGVANPAPIAKPRPNSLRTNGSTTAACLPPER